jgi:cellulose synthase (UDP-forming)
MATALSPEEHAPLTAPEVESESARLRPRLVRPAPALEPYPGYLARWRVAVARVAALVCCVGGGFYVTWRLRQLPELGPLAWVFFGLELFTYVNLLTALPLMWSPRPRRWAPPARGTLDVFITVCGEDPRMVEQTALAALEIEYPHNTYICNDGRIAGKDNWREIEALARRLGILCFTRTDGFRGKAGNLNHALRRTNGEFVAVIDADHLASPELGDDLLGHFHPRVAFVCTRQRFRPTTANDHLGNDENFFYTVIQPAKDADNAAFSCGNGVIYRRAALDDVGGFSEWNLVEDLHTSYLLHSRGWHSVYVPRAVTTGTAPETAAELAAQRLRWATDSMRLFFWDCPLFNRNLTYRQRMHYAQTAGLYYMTTCMQILFMICPVLSVLAGLEVMAPNTTATYAAHLSLIMIPVAIMLVAFAGPRGALRTLQMQAFLAPITCIAAVRALRMRPGSKRRKASGVTNKTNQQVFNFVTLVQHGLFLMLLVAIGVGLAKDGGPEWGSILWACVMAIIIAPLNGVISLRHDVSQHARIALTAPALVAGAVALIAMWSPFPVDGPDVAAQTVSTGGAPAVSKAPQPPPPRLALEPPRRGVYLGTYRPALVDVHDGPVPLGAYGNARMRIVHRFQDWFGKSPQFDRRWAERVAAAGAVPMITWEPWRKPAGTVTDPDQRPGLLRDIADGRYDGFIRRYAAAVAAYRRPVIMRPMHEMNGTWYPWRVEGNGNAPEDYRRAFVHLHRVFDRANATNATWEFSIDSLAGGPPTAKAELDAYYPGSRYVDWVGISGFNWGPDGAYPVWRSFEDTFTPTYDVLAAYAKPIMVSEVGTVSRGGDPAAWVHDALAALEELPQIKAMVWFDADTPDADFRLGGPTLNALSVEGRSRALRPPLRTREEKS